MNLLIVDDDHDLVLALAARCRSIGFDVTTAHDGFTALSLAHDNTFDIICLDCEMPGGNGLAVCEMLANTEARQSTSIIMLTGRTDPEMVQRCHALTAYYVPKCPDIWERIEPLLNELRAT
jgi:DNA-binding response OmpR family regulator